MLLSNSVGQILKYSDLKTAVDILVETGYDAGDFSSHLRDEFYTDIHSKEYYTDIRKYAEDKGLIFNQAHAPFPSASKDAEENEIIFKNVITSIKNASYLGVRDIVVHPCQHLEYNKDNNADILFEYNMDFYKRLIPYCEEYGIKVALENMWQYIPGTTKITHSTCSTPEEFVRYLDELNSNCFVACLDIGHAELVCQDLTKFIKALGGKYLKALHVHDVDGISDSHTAPYFGITDWDKVMRALAEINYTGDFTYEAGKFVMNKPIELIPAGYEYMAKTGRYLINKFNKYSKKEF